MVSHSTSAAIGSPHDETHRTLRDRCPQPGSKNYFGPGNGLRHLVLTEFGIAPATNITPAHGGRVIRDELGIDREAVRLGTGTAKETTPPRCSPHWQ